MGPTPVLVDSSMAGDPLRKLARRAAVPVGRRAWLGGLAVALTLAVCPARAQDIAFRTYFADDAVRPATYVEHEEAMQAPIIVESIPEVVQPVPSQGEWSYAAEAPCYPVPPCGPSRGRFFRSPACGPSGPSPSDMARQRWLRHPISMGWMAGVMAGSPLVEDWVGQKGGFLGEYWFGWDVHPAWGWETRLAFASVELYDSDRAKLAQHQMDDDRGILANDPYRLRFRHRRDAERLFWDIRFLWYPYTDDRWRVYLATGVGVGKAEFMDRVEEITSATVLTVPVALGVKCRVDRRIVLRLECGNRFSFGGDLEPLKDFSLTAGFEVRLGGTCTSYWPWNPGL